MASRVESRTAHTLPSQESVAQVIGLLVGPMGVVRTNVTEDHGPRAQEVLEEHCRDYNDAQNEPRLARGVHPSGARTNSAFQLIPFRGSRVGETPDA